MSAKPCPRLWQAEANVDGYLSRSDAASFERHVATCAACSAERAMLARLQSIAERMPALEISPLRRRALHNELLSRANSALEKEGRPLLARSWIWLSLAACAVGFLLVVLMRAHSSVVTGGGAEPAYRLVAAPGGRWHISRPGSSLRLFLEEGVFTIFVNKLKVNQRFALDLPDGELEVRGTRFTVRVDRQRTIRVAVEAGHVALRLAGHVETMLGPGDEWPIAALVEPIPPAPATGGVGVNPSAARPGPPFASSNVPPARGAHAQSPPYHRDGPPKADPTAPTSGAGAAAIGGSDGGVRQPTAGEDFARAMTTFSRGDYGTAEQLLDAFEAHYPGSSHTEDVLFLRALTRSRRGDQQGASRLAHEYLRRYPAGFRIEEAERMAHELRKPSEPGR